MNRKHVYLDIFNVARGSDANFEARRIPPLFSRDVPAGSFFRRHFDFTIGNTVRRAQKIPSTSFELSSSLNSVVRRFVCLFLPLTKQRTQVRVGSCTTYHTFRYKSPLQLAGGICRRFSSINNRFSLSLA